MSVNVYLSVNVYNVSKMHCMVFFIIIFSFNFFSFLLYVKHLVSPLCEKCYTNKIDLLTYLLTYLPNCQLGIP